MKIILSTIIIFASFLSHANREYVLLMDYQRTSSRLDSTLARKKSVYEFEFPGVQDEQYKVRYSIDGKNKTFIAQPGKRLIIMTTPGKHVFQFYTRGYSEVVTDSLLIQPRHRDVYNIFMRVPQVYEQALKPVIYLYPTEETEMTVEMDIKGTNAILYPEYKENWKFTAQPNGDLKFDDNTYNYLFWEAEISNPHELIKDRSGFFVERDEVVSFLEDKLTLANLSSKEKADFITFWGPRLAQNDLNFVHFIFNEECDDYAGLSIDPAPDNIYRIYIIWAPAEEIFEIETQTIVPAKRDGLHVVEWGGQKQHFPKNTALLKH